MRWFFYYITVDRPVGGLKQVRMLAALLRELGQETYLLRDRALAPGESAWDEGPAGSGVPEAPFDFTRAGDCLGPDDILVLPEVVLEGLLPACANWRCRIALNNQNGFYSLRFSPLRWRAGRRVEFALSNAPYVAAICKDLLGVPGKRIFNVPHWVVRPPFDVRDDEAPRRLAVCYMPRKLPEQVRQVRTLVETTHPDVSWVEIDRMSEAEVARTYRATSIFFAAHDLEGCPLTALEAMACGCLVAGYPGTARFPHPYATPDNGLWAPDRDVQAAAAAVRQAIDVVRSDAQRSRQYLAAGRRTALRFGKAAVRDALAAMVAVVEKQTYDSRTQEPPGLGWRGTLYAYRLLYNYDRLGWPGRLLSGLSRATRTLRRPLRLTSA